MYLAMVQLINIVRRLFSLLTDYIFKSYKHLSKIIYNFSESGHGKGAADRVGALTKRTTDNIIANGEDVNAFQKLFEVLYFF